MVAVNGIGALGFSFSPMITLCSFVFVSHLGDVFFT